MSPTTIRTLALSALCAVPVTAQAVSPATRADVEGNKSTSYPLGRHNARFQQIHADLPPGLTTLTGHGYRRDAISTRGNVAGFQTEIEVQLSVAANAPSAASGSFSNNRGANVVTVLPPTWISFPSTSRPAVDPSPTFDLVVPYTTPFPRPAGAAICVEMVIHGNQTSSSTDSNFTAYLDAHQLEADGFSEQPGFRFGSGCPAMNQNTAHYGRFLMTRTATDVTLEIESRYGVPTTDPVNPTLMMLAVGLTPDQSPWSWLPNCTTWTSFDVLVNLPGSTDAQGHWNGSISGLQNMPEGFRFLGQLVSGNTTTGDLTFSDGSWITVPVIDETPIPAIRVAAASNRDATSGTVSSNVPVTMFF